MQSVNILTLRPVEWKRYRDLRLRALKEEPQAYASTHADNISHPNHYWEKLLTKAQKETPQWLLLFAEQENTLLGMIGAFMHDEKDSIHIIAVYVIKEARGLGISKKLMNEMILRIKKYHKIQKILVEVNTKQIPALNLYKQFGFTVIKKEDQILGDGKKHLCYLMERKMHNA